MYHFRLCKPFLIMKFHKYPSIENHYLSAFIEKIYRNLPNADEIEWEVTEKIHGTNVQVATDGVEIVIGKRTSKIEVGENFYNALNVMKFMEEPIKALWEHVKAENPNATQVVCYGELFGGCYPHPDVPAIVGESKIQQGIWYSPFKHWRCFDIAVEFDDGNFVFFSPKFRREICEELNIPQVPFLGIIKGLKEALGMANNRLSEVYKNYGLPPIEDNSMEGIVMKPEAQDVEMGDDRCIVKSKNPEFEDKKHGKKVVVPKEIPQNVKDALEKVDAYCTMARVDSAISKIGECTHKDIGKVIGMASKDVIADVQKELNVFDILEKSEQKVITSHIANTMAKFAKERLLR